MIDEQKSEKIFSNRNVLTTNLGSDKLTDGHNSEGVADKHGCGGKKGKEADTSDARPEERIREKFWNLKPCPILLGSAVHIVSIIVLPHLSVWCSVLLIFLFCLLLLLFPFPFPLPVSLVGRLVEFCPWPRAQNRFNSCSQRYVCKLRFEFFHARNFHVFHGRNFSRQRSSLKIWPPNLNSARMARESVEQQTRRAEKEKRRCRGAQLRIIEDRLAVTTLEQKEILSYRGKYMIGKSRSL